VATRLYFSSSQSAPQSVGFAAWAQTNSVTKMALLTAPLAGDDFVLGLQQLTTVGSLRLDRQFVSPAVVNSTFLNGQVNCQIAAREFNNGDNTNGAMACRIVTASGTLRGTLMAPVKNGAVELINNATLRNNAFASGTVITSVTALPNDRLVIEIGFGDNSGATPEFQARYGAPSGINAHAQDNTETTSLVPWFEFANTYASLFSDPSTVRLQSLSDNMHTADVNRLGRFMLMTDRQQPIVDSTRGDYHRCYDYLFLYTNRNRVFDDRQETKDELVKRLAKAITENQRPFAELVSGYSIGATVCRPQVFVTAIRNRLLLDDEQVSDTLTKLIAKIVAESQDVSDAAVVTTIAGLIIVLRTLSDALDVNDGFNKLLGMNQQESEAFTEAFNKTLSKNLTEQQDGIDALAKAMNKVIADQQAPITEAVVSYMRRVVGASDEISVRDDRSSTLRKMLGDLGVLSDERYSSLFKSIGDRQDVSDTVNVNLIVGLILLAIADTLALTDDFRKSLFKVTGDLGSISDAHAKLLGKNIGDRQDLSDAVITSIGVILLMIAESLSLSETERKALFKNVGDLGDIFDSESMGLNKSIADRQDVSDTANRMRTALLAISDSLNLSDAFAKSLLKLFSDDVQTSDLFVKALTKRLGDDAALRDEFASQFSKTIGESQGAADLFALALSKTISERQDFTDDALLARYLRRLFSDDVILTDTADRTKITNQLIVEVLETQDVSDALVKNLFKVLAENVDAADAIILTHILGVPVLRQFIESMVAGFTDPQGKAWGARAGFGMTTGTDTDRKEHGTKAGIKMVADDDDVLEKEHGSKGRRQK
jgi:hypothetical protein